jgi:hypothetical protein
VVVIEPDGAAASRAVALFALHVVALCDLPLTSEALDGEVLGLCADGTCDVGVAEQPIYVALEGATVDELDLSVPPFDSASAVGLSTASFTWHHGVEAVVGTATL